MAIWRKVHYYFKIFYKNKRPIYRPFSSEYLTIFSAILFNLLNTDVFPRIRIGIGRPMFKEMTIAYVLEKISKEEREILDKAIDKAADATIDIIEKGIDKTMNMYN